MQPAQDRLGDHDNTLAETMLEFLVVGRRRHSSVPRGGFRVARNRFALWA
jgi:hypothetical protein